MTIEKMEQKRFKIIDFIAEAKIRLGRGQNLFYDLRNAVLISASLKVIFSLTTQTAAILSVIVLIAFYCTGYIDLRWFGLMQREQELVSGKYNPHLNQITKISEKFK